MKSKQNQVERDTVVAFVTQTVEQCDRQKALGSVFRECMTDQMFTLNETSAVCINVNFCNESVSE